MALQLRRYLMRISRPWWGFSNLRIFLDKEAMVAVSQLRQQIADILSASAAMVLLACPGSARSPWVSEEVDQWVKERGERPLVVVHTGGELTFRPPSPGGGVDWTRTTALNPEPFHKDAARSPEMNSDRAQEHIYWISTLLPVAKRLSDQTRALGRDATGTNTPVTGLPRLRQAVATTWAGRTLRHPERRALRETAMDIVAGVLDLDRDRLSSFETRRRRLAFAAVACVTVALAALLTATVVTQVREQQERELAFSRQLAADSVR